MTNARASDFFNQSLGYNNLSIGQVQQTNSDLQDENSVAYMARLNYIFNSKYALTATIRRDGFSGFSRENKYAVFPSVALAWTVSNEDFLSNSDFLSLLKSGFPMAKMETRPSAGIRPWQGLLIPNIFLVTVAVP
jgi:TonB-dependent starch-binding outer membrane protein SusC